MSAFNNLVNNLRDRDWGGTDSAIAAEPYISGYSFISWSLPEALVQYCKQFTLDYSIKNTNIQTGINNVAGNNDNVTKDSMSDVLEHAMMSVTPPGGTINRVQFQGLGGKKWAVPGGIDYGDTISVKYTEFSGLPINRIHRAWCNMIRDNKIGLTALSGATAPTSGLGGYYYKHDYSATLLYWTTKPDGVTVEFAAGYSGLFPTKDPMDLFNGDITAIDKLEIEIEYNVDMIHNEREVWQTCQKLAAMNANGAKGKTRWSRDGFRHPNQYDKRHESAMVNPHAISSSFQSPDNDHNHS